MGTGLTHRVAVIGAGLAGLACARVLRKAGCYVELFERDQTIAGRMGTLRVGVTSFDHGAQYITARSTEFRKYLQELASTGYARTWEPAIANDAEGGGRLLPWYVGTPGMSAVVRPLAESVRVNTRRELHTIKRGAKGWQLWFADGSDEGPFAAVAVAVPAPEAMLLLGPLTEMADTLSAVRLSPCWAVAIQIESHVLPDLDVFSDMSQVVRWVSRNNSKPGRPSRGDHIVVHASQAFSRETEDEDPESIAEVMWNEVCHVLNLPPVRPAAMSAHLWKHGLVEVPLGERYLFSSAHRVGVAGDWCWGRLGEHAFESGIGLGNAIVGALQDFTPR